MVEEKRLIPLKFDLMLLVFYDDHVYEKYHFLNYRVFYL